MREPTTLRYPDAAKRMRDWMNLHRSLISDDQLVSRRCFVAIRLEDGGSDGVVYESREDAIRHQLHANGCLFMPLPAERLSEAACDSLLHLAKQAHRNGFRPDSNPEVGLYLPMRAEEYR